MATVTTSTKSLDKKKIQEFYDDIVMDVMYNYFESKILGFDSFPTFITRNKPKLFHQYKPTTLCCQCRIQLCYSAHRKATLSEKQFHLLFQRISQPLPNHEITENNVIVQNCLCHYSPNTSYSVLDLDIVMICNLIKSCCVSYPGNPRWLDDIKEVRNTISHLGDEVTLTNKKKEELFTKLGVAVINVASTIGDVYRVRVKRRIDKFKTEFSYLQMFTEAVLKVCIH